MIFIFGMKELEGKKMRCDDFGIYTDFYWKRNKREPEEN
jgi:hypothetical protein